MLLTNKMEPRYIVYDLKDNLNVDRFMRLAEKEDYLIQEQNTPYFLPFRRGNIFSKHGGPTQGVLDSKMLYVISDFENKMWDLDNLVKNFELE